MKQIIAMHGWSGDSNGWQNWIPYFKNHGWYWQSGERGYGELPPINPQWEQNAFSNEVPRRVIIGHSLGPHLLESKVLEEATDLVLLASFSRFVPNGPKSRLIQAALTGMHARLGTKDEKAMLNNFLAKACEPLPVNHLPEGPIQKGLSIQGRTKLQADLQLLMSTQGLPKGFPPEARVLVIQGEQDAVLVEATKNHLIKDLEQHLQKSITHWKMKNSGHTLICPELIQDVHKWLESQQ